MNTRAGSVRRPINEVRQTRVTRLQSVAMLIGGISLIIVGLVPVVFDLGTRLPQVGAVLAVSWVLAGFSGAFQVSISRNDMSIAHKVLTATTTATVLTTTILVLAGQELTATNSLISGALASLLLFGGIQAGRFVVRTLWSSGKFRTTAIVVGGSQLTDELAVELRHSRDLGIDVVGHIDLRREPGAHTAPQRVLDAIESLRPDRLVLGETAFNEAEWVGALRRAGELGTRVYVLPRLFEMGVGNALFASDELRGFALQRINRPAHPRASRFLKRCVDIAVSAVGLLAVLPFLVMAAALIKATSPGPVLFWQERVGQHNRPIRVPKLRSMRVSATSDTEWTAEARISPIGKILRRSALDEVPQLWSVLVGDMSLVGPRPERPAFVEQFSGQYTRYQDRHRMRAGLTGLSQIAGLRGDTSIAERAKYDNRYIDQWTLSGDFVILARTVVAIVRERVYADRQQSLTQALSDGVVEGIVLDDTEQVSTDQVPTDQPTAIAA